MHRRRGKLKHSFAFSRTIKRSQSGKWACSDLKKMFLGPVLACGIGCLALLCTGCAVQRSASLPGNDAVSESASDAASSFAASSETVQSESQAESDADVQARTQKAGELQQLLQSVQTAADDNGWSQDEETVSQLQAAQEFLNSLQSDSSLQDWQQQADDQIALLQNEVLPRVSEKKGPTVTEKNGVTYVDGVLIVNKTYSIPADYGDGITPEAQAAFDRMQADAAAQGISLWICSGYRSYGYQSTLYQNYVARDGQAAADTYSARPGHSEHQTGLAMDINSTDGSMATSAEGLWLAAHCSEYGFIIRYPEGKEDITGYQYEPWHIRYLGEELAAKVTASGETLEEYFGLTSQYADDAG